MKDAPDEARRFAWALNVRLPIARYTPEMDEVFNIRALPTVIVVDRNRRVRGRWSNAQEETRQKIDKLVLELLDEVEPPSRASVATVLRGSGRLAMRWSRHLPGRIEGLALLPGNQTADATLVAALGRELGRFTERKPAARGVGRLAAGGADLVGYRRGGVRVVTVHRNGDAGRGWDAPAPVLDLRFPHTPVSGGAELMLATTSGLHRVDLRGKQLAGRPDLGSLRSVAFDGEAPVGLDSTGKLIWLDAGLETLRSDGAPSPAVWLVSSEGEHGGVGAATAGVTSSAVGRFLGGESFQLALAVEEQLVLLDIVSGEERFRARWPRIGLLAGGDLDGDGREELIVGSGRRLSVLEPGADPEQASP
jgi:hypothetical protein